MKIMQLMEKITAIVYHYTDIHSAAKILEEKRFRLTAASGTDSEKKINRNKFYYLSTSRGKTGDYTLHSVYKIGVVFVLNGDWFNDRHQGGPVDYWERMWLRSREAGAKDRFSEMEDRIFSDEPYINMKNMADAIREVHVLYEEEEKTSKYLKSVISSCLKNKIPLYLYEDKEAFILQNKRKTVPVKDWIKKLNYKKEPAYQRIATDWLARYKELYYKKTKSELSKEGDRARTMVLYYPQDAVTGISADIHNMRRNDADKVKGFLDIMRKGKFKSVKEFVDKMHDKWEKLND